LYGIDTNPPDLDRLAGPTGSGSTILIKPCLQTAQTAFGPTNSLFFAVMLLSVLRIWIRRIHMFLGLLDPDPLVREMDPDPLSSS
jgi:hypothetical protein